MWGGKLGKFIFFSRRLGFDLVEYGEGLRRKLKRKFGRDFPLVKILWDKAEEKGLFPPDEVPRLVHEFLGEGAAHAGAASWQTFLHHTSHVAAIIRLKSRVLALLYAHPVAAV